MGNISLDRWLDIIGIVLAFVGFLTVLTLLSSTKSSWVAAWMTLLAQAFGWGMYVFPFALIVTGLWLILRNFERIPSLHRAALGLCLAVFDLLVDLPPSFTGSTRWPWACDLAAKAAATWVAVLLRACSRAGPRRRGGGAGRLAGGRSGDGAGPTVLELFAWLPPIFARWTAR